MNLKSRLDQLEQSIANDAERAVCVLHRRKGETAAECLKREGIEHPVWIFPPPEPRGPNGEFAPSWIAGCVRWTGERFEPVGPNFNPRDCDPIFDDPDCDIW